LQAISGLVAPWFQWGFSSAQTLTFRSQTAVFLLFSAHFWLFLGFVQDYSGLAYRQFISCLCPLQAPISYSSTLLFSSKPCWPDALSKTSSKAALFWSIFGSF